MCCIFSCVRDWKYRFSMASVVAVPSVADHAIFWMMNVYEKFVIINACRKFYYMRSFCLINVSWWMTRNLAKAEVAVNTGNINCMNEKPRRSWGLLPSLYFSYWSTLRSIYLCTLVELTTDVWCCTHRDPSLTWLANTNQNRLQPKPIYIREAHLVFCTLPSLMNIIDKSNPKPSATQVKEPKQSNISGQK